MKGKAGRVKGEAAEGVRSPTSNTVDNHRGLESPKGWATEGSHGAQRQEGHVKGNVAGNPGRVQEIRVQLDWTGCRAWPWPFQVLIPSPHFIINSCVTLGDTSLISGSRRSPGGGHGNPLQYSCLENPSVRGAWWAAVHGVTKNQT